MYRTGITTLLLAASQLIHGLVIEKPGDLLRRAEGENREADYLDEVVYLAGCDKYKKGSSDRTGVESFFLYFEVYDYVPKNKSAKTIDRIIAPYPKGQRVDPMGTRVDWTLAKEDSKLSAKFANIDKTFKVWDLDKK